MRLTCKKWARLCAPTLLFLIVAEVAARYHFQGVYSPLQPDEILNHVWKPNETRMVGEFVTKGIQPYKKVTNAQGWLAPYNFSQTKPEGTFRIVYMGDSFTEGTCEDKDSLPSIVQRELKLPNIATVEVMNTGTSSYSPTLYYLLLKTKILDFAPDLIVINVDMSDVFDDSIYRATLEVDAQGEPVACRPGHPALATHRRTARGLEELTLLQRAVIRAASLSKLVDLVLRGVTQSRDEYADLAGATVPPSFAWCSHDRDGRTQKDVDWSMSMLRRIIRLARDRGIRIAITGVPHLQQIQGRWSLRPMEDLAAICKQEGVPFLNPAPALKQRLGDTPPEEIYIPKDMHFNTRGYRLWSDIQLEFLSGLLRPSGEG